MRIYVLGNLLVDEDSLPVKLLPVLKKDFPEIDFIEIDPSEDIKPEKTIIVIDTIINSKKVCLVDDTEKIELGKVCSLHDFDLGYNLKLMKKFGMIKKAIIIGVPPNYEINKAEDEIKKLISTLSLGNE